MIKFIIDHFSNDHNDQQISFSHLNSPMKRIWQDHFRIFLIKRNFGSIFIQPKSQSYKQFQVTFYKKQMMSPKIGASISLHRRKSKIRSVSSFTQDNKKQTIQTKQSIPDLINKFVSLSKEIKIQPQFLNFNYSSDPFDAADTIFDKNYATAKLRGIQNKHTLKKANQQLFQREKKVLKNKASGFFSTLTSDTEKGVDSYHQKLDAILNDKISRQQKSWSELLDFSDQEVVQMPQLIVSPEKDLLYFDQLKNHPKLLNFTLRKIRSRKTKEQIEYQRKQKIKKEFRQGINQFCEPSQTIPSLKKFYSADDQAKGPLQIQLDKLYRKVYTKRTKNYEAEEARQDPILSSFLQQQEKIALKAGQTIQSKQNCDKLKERFDKILGQMYRNHKKYRNSDKQQKKTNLASLLDKKIITQRLKMFDKQRR